MRTHRDGGIDLNLNGDWRINPEQLDGLAGSFEGKERLMMTLLPSVHRCLGRGSC